jgi:hypothetical protein
MCMPGPSVSLLTLVLAVATSTAATGMPLEADSCSGDRLAGLDSAAADSISRAAIPWHIERGISFLRVLDYPSADAPSLSVALVRPTDLADVTVVALFVDGRLCALGTRSSVDGVQPGRDAQLQWNRSLSPPSTEGRVQTESAASVLAQVFLSFATGWVIKSAHQDSIGAFEPLTLGVALHSSRTADGWLLQTEAKAPYRFRLILGRDGLVRGFEYRPDH